MTWMSWGCPQEGEIIPYIEYIRLLDLYLMSGCPVIFFKFTNNVSKSGNWNHFYVGVLNFDELD